MNIDPVRLTGLLTWDGAAIPQSSSNRWDLVFRSTTSDAVLRVPRDAEDGAVSTYDIPMLPGSWDVSFQWTQTASDSSSAWPDPILGELPVASNVVVPAGGGSFNIEVDPVRLTGLWTWDGAAVPQSGSNQWDLVYTNPSTGNELTVRRDAGDGAVGTYDVPALPGTWDLAWRWVSVAGEGSSAWPDPIWGDLPAGSVTVPAGGGARNVQIDPVRLTGLLSWDGAAIPQSSSNQWSLRFVDGDTVLEVDRDASDGAVNVYDVPALTGSWDLEFVWNGAAAPTSSAFPDPIYGGVPVGSVTVPAGGGSFNVQPDPVRLSGLLAWDGAAIPQSTSNQWQIGFTDSTGRRLWVPRTATGSVASTYDVPAMPGLWDVDFTWTGTAVDSSSAWPDPIWGRIEVQNNVNVPAGGGSLNVQPDPTRLSGLLSWDGGAINQTSSNEWEIRLTPAGGGETLTVRRDAGNGAVSVYDIPAFAGSWDVEFRWYTASPENSGGWVDPILGGPLDLTSVTIPAAGGSLNIQPDPVRQTGALLWEGAALPWDGSNRWEMVWTDPYGGRVLTVPRFATSSAQPTYDVPAWPGVWHLGYRWVQTVGDGAPTWPDPIEGVIPVATCIEIQ